MRTKFYLSIFMLPLFFACGNKTKKAPTSTEEVTQTETKVEQTALVAKTEIGMISKISKGKIYLEDGSAVEIPGYQDPNAIILFCVRHCEKDNDGTPNPPLTKEGEARADRLGQLLQGEPINRIATTNYKRTVKTGEIVSPHVLAAPLETYPPEVQKDWIDEILQNDKGGKFVVVGHQNTVPDLANYLTQSSEFPMIEDSVFGNLYIISTYGLGKTQVWQGTYK